MKVITIILTILGISIGTILVGYFGFQQILRALFAVGWLGFFAMVALQLVGITILGFCWHLLVPKSGGLLAFVWGRLVRDSGSEVLPLSQLGGFVMGARAATVLGVPGVVAIASTIVDVSLEFLGQLAYVATGVVILAYQRPDMHLAGWIGFALAAALIAALGFVKVQRHRSLGMLERAAWRLARQWFKGPALPAQPIHHEIHAIYSRPAAAFLSTAIHFAAWTFSSLQAWIVLGLMGTRLDIQSVIVIESLLYAVRSVAFAVPNAVGVQEAAYIALGSAFGLRPELALALSLLKRGRDLFIGVPALLTWQVLEARRIVAAPARARPRDHAGA